MLKGHGSWPSSVFGRPWRMDLHNSRDQRSAVHFPHCEWSSGRLATCQRTVESRGGSAYTANVDRYIAIVSTPYVWYGDWALPRSPDITNSLQTLHPEVTLGTLNELKVWAAI